MARKKINKSEKIRETLSTMGVDAAPKDVIAALAEKKIKVSAAQVSNVKTALRGKSKPSRGKNGTLSLKDLLAAKDFAGKIGLEKARAALATLEKLRD